MAWKDWGTQKKNFFLSQAVQVDARKKTTFSALAGKESQPLNSGDELFKYVEYPIIHEMNKNDKGIDANGAQLVKNKWYAYDVNGAQTGSYDTLHEAKDAAGATGTVLSGNGNVYGGDTDYAVIKGASFPALRETGGLVNRLGMTRLEVSTKIHEYGLYLDFTERELKLTDDAKLLTKKSKALGEALAEMREKQTEIALLDASEVNRMYAGDATSLDTVGIGDTVSLSTVRRMQEYMKKARTPKQTKVIDGSTNVDTVTVGKGYFAYYPQGLLSTLEEVKDADGIKVWQPVEKYMAGAGYVHPEEEGKISNTRFIEVEGMAVYKGTGALTDTDDDGTNDTGAEKYEYSLGSDGKNRYDVYPILYVGGDSFANVKLSSDNVAVKHAMPQIIPGVDAYGKNGIVSVSFWGGTLIYRPERISAICTASLVG